MRLLPKLVIVFTLLHLLGCQNDENQPDQLTTGLIKDQIITVDDIERSFHLFIPENPDNRPLVVLLHGNGSSNDDLLGEGGIKSPHKVWLTLAEQEEFLVVLPNGTLGQNDQRGWNDCRSDANGNPNADDVSFINELLDQLKDQYNYDEDKIYVEGISNGAHMAFRLVQELPNRITAIATIAASIPVNSQCNDSDIPISALIINGTDDPINPYEGGEMASNRGTVLSTDASIDYWIDRNQTSTNPVIEQIPNINTNDGCEATKYIYQNTQQDIEVVLYKIQNGGHTEPSIQERYSNIFLVLVGNQNSDFEMAEEIWDFFKTKSK